MASYVLLTRVGSSALSEPSDFERLNRMIGQKVQEDCPEVKWQANYMVLGPYDHLDVFDAPDNEVAARVALIVRSIAHAQTEVWPAVTWERFKEIAQRVA